MIFVFFDNFVSMALEFVQAVHSGADLESAIANCMGYKAEVIGLA